MSCCLDLHPIYEHEHATFEWCQIASDYNGCKVYVHQKLAHIKNKPTKVE